MAQPLVINKNRHKFKCVLVNIDFKYFCQGIVALHNSLLMGHSQGSQVKKIFYPTFIAKIHDFTRLFKRGREG